MPTTPTRPPRRLCWLLLLAAVAGCATRPAAEPSRGLARIARTSEIRIGTSGGQPPLSMTSRTGELVGLDVALARVLARSMGVAPVFVRLPFHRLIDALEAGDVDIVMSGMTITPERSARVAFVGPYITSGKCVLSRSEALSDAELDELNLSSNTIAVLAGSTSEGFARQSLPNARLTPSETLENAIRMVIQGSAHALVADRETCAFALLRHPGAGLYASDRTFTIEPMGIAVPPDDPRLANMIESYVTALANRGVIAKARDFWFEDPSWVKEIP